MAEREQRWTLNGVVSLDRGGRWFRDTLVDGPKLAVGKRVEVVPAARANRAEADLARAREALEEIRAAIVGAKYDAEYWPAPDELAALVESVRYVVQQRDLLCDDAEARERRDLSDEGLLAAWEQAVADQAQPYPQVPVEPALLRSFLGALPWPPAKGGATEGGA